jgi:hypothetical protein
VYVEQPPGFESEGYPNHVYKLHKALGLKQAPRAWYECLRDFLIKNSFRIGKADSTLFTRKMGKDLFVCQIYVDDIIFDSTNKSFCDEFSKIMMDRLEMSMIRVLTFFLEFQIKQAKEGTFISQTKYTLKKFGMDKAKPIKTHSLAAAKGSLADFGSSPLNSFGFLEIWLHFPSGSSNPSGSLSPKVFSRFSFDFFDLLLNFINARSL